MTAPTLRQLKSRAQQLKPVIHLGKAGPTPEFLAAFGVVLDRNQLVKLRFEAMKDERKNLSRKLAEITGSPRAVQPIQKLDLDLLGNGDKIVVRTANSTYNFEMHDRHSCKVVPSKSTARNGEATLMGGTNADASEYTPNRILVGGRAAYQFPDEESAVLTSVIVSIFLVAAGKPA